MFVCSGCEHHAKDEQLTFTLLHYHRVDHPSAAMFHRRFCSRDCLVAYLRRLVRHADQHVLTDCTGPEPVTTGPATIADLLDGITGPKRKTA